MSGTLHTVAANGIHQFSRWEMRRPPDLETLRRLIGGGYIERVQVNWEGRCRQAYVDEDGIQKQLQINPFAMKLLTPRWQGSRIWGTLVVWVPDKKEAKK